MSEEVLGFWAFGLFGALAFWLFLLLGVLDLGFFCVLVFWSFVFVFLVFWNERKRKKGVKQK